MGEIAFLSYLMLIIKIKIKNNDNEDDDNKFDIFCKMSASSTNFFIIYTNGNTKVRLGSWHIDDHVPSQEQYPFTKLNPSPNPNTRRKNPNPYPNPFLIWNPNPQFLVNPKSKLKKVNPSPNPNPFNYFLESKSRL